MKIVTVGYRAYAQEEAEHYGYYKDDNHARNGAINWALNLVVNELRAEIAGTRQLFGKLSYNLGQHIGCCTDIWIPVGRDWLEGTYEIRKDSEIHEGIFSYDASVCISGQKIWVSHHRWLVNNLASAAIDCRGEYPKSRAW